MITYTVTKTTTETKQLCVPHDWAMYSDVGNKRITKLANQLYKKLEADKSYKNYVKQVTSFVKAYTKLSSFKTYREASDTEVRECVYDFLEEVERALDYNCLSYIWSNR